MITLLWIVVAILTIALYAIITKKPATFGKAAFMNLVNQVRTDFGDPKTQKLVVKYIKTTTGICGVTFTAMSELKADINKNGTEIGENTASISEMQAEIRQLERRSALLANENTVLDEYSSLCS